MKQKALSIQQPWANLVVWGLKSIEIRTWSTRYRGSLLIHASQNVDKKALKRFPMQQQSLGAVIGRVELVDVRPFTEELWAESADAHLDSGAYVSGLYAWFIADPVPLEHSVPCRGKPGLFEVNLEEGCE